MKADDWMYDVLHAEPPGWRVEKRERHEREDEVEEFDEEEHLTYDRSTHYSRARSR